ncbi:citrate synthase [Devosia elaeis]|uniref:citrate synthase (unknown stereospecificity) n=1 Tax=Devosia elaeis TaxID=1770058 RepID=A0A178HQF6_9HYPH|nr:citrate synthase [Devosia elaeis]OAM75071.1 citrate synthase [Devosia elaeis]
MSWISAEAALGLLGTKPQTLYANVSRGRIAARPDPQDPRRSLYRAEDVERLAARQRGRRPAQQVAAETIAWGEPVLPTEISAIVDGRLMLRGEDAIALAETATLEDIARHLWQASHRPDLTGSTDLGVPGLRSAYLAMAELAATQMPTPGRARAVLIDEAEAALATMATALAGPGAAPMHERLAACWGRPEAADPLRRALVLLAEHELNASTFAARVTASTGAPLAAAVLTGLAALSGPLHGTASQSLGPLHDHARRAGAESAVIATLGYGQGLPCFGHKLYEDGDSRAAALLGAMTVPPLFSELMAEGERLSGEKPNIDFALAALTQAYELPEDAPLQIFALARSVGWLAHALEQIETGALIRPRARYVGPAPS